MKIISKVLIGLAGLVGGALIERGVSGYADDIKDMRQPKPDDTNDDDTTTTEGEGANQEKEDDQQDADQEDNEDG